MILERGIHYHFFLDIAHAVASFKPNEAQTTPQTPSRSQLSSQSQSQYQAIQRQQDVESLYAPSTTSTRVSTSSHFGSFSRLPLLSRSRPSTSSSATSSTAGSATRSQSGSLLKGIFQKSRDPAKKKEKERQKGNSEDGSSEAQMTKPKPRDPVKTIPSGKPPAVEFADLAYRYGGPSMPVGRRL